MGCGLSSVKDSRVYHHILSGVSSICHIRGSIWAVVREVILTQ